MSYATVDQFKAWFEGRGHRLDSYMQEKDVDGDQETQITEALNAASGIMDMYFQDGGYAVPIVTADAGALEDELKDLLAKRCIDLAVIELLPGLVQVPPEADDQQNIVMRWLEKIRGNERFGPRGRLEFVQGLDLPGLPR
jgi:phage gp36-like protein